jgi:hypothetical protein
MISKFFCKISRCKKNIIFLKRNLSLFVKVYKEYMPRGFWAYEKAGKNLTENLAFYLIMNDFSLAGVRI